MTNEQIRQQIVDMIPFAHMERFETLWTMLTPKYERLTTQQIKQQQELENEREVFWSALEDVVCSVVGVPSQALYSPTRKREIVTARQIIFFLVRPCYLLSLKNVGDRYKKDHATILHGINQASAQVEWDRQYRSNVERICYLLSEIGYAIPMIFFSKFVEHIEYKKELALKKKSKIK
jgi:hypothetical protein